MAIAAGNSTDIFYRHVEIVPRPGTDRVFSSSADGSYNFDIRGQLVYEHCRFMHMGDDCINQNTHYLEVSQRVDDYRLVLWAARYLQGSDVGILALGRTASRDPAKMLRPTQFEVGDEIEFGKNETPLDASFTGKVRECILDGDAKVLKAAFTERLPAWIQPGVYVGNASATPRVRISDSVFGKNRGAGAVLMGRNAVIERNIFEACSGQAIRLNADRGRWYEGLSTRNTIIRSNSVRDCHYGLGAKGGAIEVWAQIQSSYDNRTPAAAGAHRGIVIEGNKISGTRIGSGIAIGSAEHVVIRGNTIAGAPESGIFVHCSSNVQIENNKISDVKENVTLGTQAFSVTGDFDDDAGARIPEIKFAFNSHTYTSGTIIGQDQWLAYNDKNGSRWLPAVIVELPGGNVLASPAQNGTNIEPVGGMRDIGVTLGGKEKIVLEFDAFFPEKGKSTMAIAQIGIGLDSIVGPMVGFWGGAVAVRNESFGKMVMNRGWAPP
ncbi:MAG: right-handed parallel beta-helix repeat-containing protein [Spirochaetota bacterium]